MAAQLGQREIVSLLLKFGADASLRDAMGRSAADAALLTGQHAIVTLLQVYIIGDTFDIRPQTLRTLMGNKLKL